MGPLLKLTNNDRYRGVIPIGIVNNKVYMVAPHLTESYPSNAVGKRHVRDIVVMDQNFESYKSVSTEKSFEGKELKFVYAFVSNSKVFTFYTFYNKDHEKEYLFMDEFDTDKNEFKNEIKQILESDCGKGNGGGDDVYKFAFSPNRSNIAIINKVRKDVSSLVTDFGFYLFDANMELKNEKKSVLGEGKWGLLQDLMVDDNGHIYSLSYKSEPDTEANSGNYYLVDYNIKTNSANEIIIKNNEKELMLLSVSINKNNKVVALGFFTEEGMRDPVGMISFCYLPEKQQFNQVDMKPFTKEFVLEATDENGLKKYEKMKDYNDNNLSPKDIVVKDDNGFVFHAEEEADGPEPTAGSYAAGITTSVHVGLPVIYNEDIFVMDVDENARINSMSVVKKKQMTNFISSHWASYAILNHNSKTYILFNDIKNSIKKAPLALVEITPDGQQKKEFLPVTDKEKVPFSVFMGQFNNTFYLYAPLPTKNCFGSVTVGKE